MHRFLRDKSSGIRRNYETLFVSDRLRDGPSNLEVRGIIEP